MQLNETVLWTYGNKYRYGFFGDRDSSVDNRYGLEGKVLILGKEHFSLFPYLVPRSRMADLYLHSFVRPHCIVLK
jgi:hypothetical protein